MATQEAAKLVVQRIAEKYGYLDKDMMDDIGTWKPEYREKLDKSWLAIETVASNAIKTLAKEIYSSGARFVFELLQNADDNKFERAIKNKELPYIKFKVYHDRIVVECNEDGFTDKNLEAICAVGQSTKAASGSGYIGNKGIGFKSVFIAASRVCIRSGNYSFQFCHRKTDPGLGMVRPEWQDTDEVLHGSLTRMTLHLHNDGTPEDLEDLHSVIRTQLEDLQETCLLFLKQLHQIQVEFYDKDDELENAKTFSKRKVDSYRASLQISSTDIDGETTETNDIYHITRMNATGLEISANRNAPDSAEGRLHATRAEVVLAFPLTEDSNPITNKRQHVFAFLPVRALDYKFLIQSDFDTNASREDVVTTSKRNLNLINWIAKTFIKAVLEFCEDSTLCYEWPLFLPSLDAESNTSPFWATLDQKIAEEIKAVPVLKSRNRRDLRLISDVFIVTTDAMLEDGTPVLDDAAKDLCLSPSYRPSVRQTLKSYGLNFLNSTQFLGLLTADLASPTSKMRAEETTEEWHSVVAKLLAKLCPTNPKIREISLLPLREKHWVSAASGRVYFPTTKGILIPNKVNLNIIDPIAISNSDRRALFEKLGASEASVATVRVEIFDKCNPTKTKSSTMGDRVAYLRYLYQTSTPNSNGNWPEKGQIWFTTHTYSGRWPHNTDMYLPYQKGKYDAKILLAATDDAPGFTVDFIHSSYMDAPPNKSTSHDLTWEFWLYKATGVREHLRLLDEVKFEFSETAQYVLKHRSDQFLGMVEHLWPYEKSRIKSSSTAQKQALKVPAKQLCQVNFDVKLDKTWLPLKALQSTIRRYMEHPENQFPLLKLESSPQSTDDQLKVKWSFLNHFFGVGRDETIDFLLQVLQYIQRSCPQPSSVSQIQKIFDLYKAIQAKITFEENEETAKEKIRDYFSTAGVLVPGDDESASWSKTSDCFWLAPPNMLTKHSLQALYARTLGEEQLNQIRTLFSKTTMVMKPSSTDIVTELHKLRTTRCTDHAQIKLLYKFLSKLSLAGSDINSVFQQSPLIYARQRGKWAWYSTINCLWSSATPIDGKATLDDDYEELKNFFVKTLGVRKLDLQMVYDELKGTKPEKNINELLMTISAFNSLLMTEKGHSLDPKPLLNASIFPVSYNGEPAILRSTETDFAIGDRDHLRDKFKDRISLLDIDLKDVRRLSPFLEWLGLTDRYLSHCVREYTSVSETSGRLIESGPRDLKAKAYYILRVAATFNTTRYQLNADNLYQQLRGMQVMETDGISLTLSVNQNNKDIRIQETAGDVHIRTTSEDVLIVYVPKKKRAQEISFSSVLPRQFADWLTQNSTNNRSESEVSNDMIGALAAIFTSSRFALDEILNRLGIVKLAIENKNPEDSNEEYEENEQEVEDEEEGGGEVEEVPNGGINNTGYDLFNHLSPSSAQDFGYESDGQETLVDSGVRQNSNFQNGISSPSPAARRQSSSPSAYRQSSSPSAYRQSSSPSAYRQSSSPSVSRARSNYSSAPRNTTYLRTTQVSDHDAETVQYLSLLNRVVAVAQRATFPSQGTFDMTSLNDALLDTPNGTIGNSLPAGFDGLDVHMPFRSTSQFERDKKIGAAGELYVFELISKLNLPEWGRGNWQSKIRAYATVHSTYTTMEAWTESETSDLVYDDTQGQFTDLLIGNGYLDDTKWRGARPRYYLEVKTTTGQSETPFYVSTNQYELMREKHESDDRSEIYIILRVFLLNSNRIGMRVYVDPWQLKEDQSLRFTGQSWKVIPGRQTNGY